MTATSYSSDLNYAAFSSPLAQELASDVLERFLRYVRIDTQSRDGSQSYPSTAKQLHLSRLLVDELQALGVADAHVDQHGYVFGTLPATVRADLVPSGRVPTVGLIAHVDTSPDASGAGVQPRIVRKYDGGEIRFSGDEHQVLRPEESPALRSCMGHDIVTTDGTTLLGADDKAGVAEIMGAVAYLVRHPEVPHGPIRIAFTPDEEIGEGTKYFDLGEFGADVAYTVDGSTVGEIEDETFSASKVVVTIRGHNVHPGYAKGKLVNSIKLAARLLEQLPKDGLSPETTEGREGYVHPMGIEGSVEQTKLTFIVRDFETDRLAAHEELLQRLAGEIEGEEPRACVTVEVSRSYRNMKDYLKDHPRALDAAEIAVQRAGLVPKRAFIRGGTDGARLSERGLPTPNLFTGAHDYHSVREWISIQDMAAAAATLVHLVQVWAE
ncbi:MAG TPA: peptidase T [Chloroflexota bacterium]|nr:peptidase T [Chloroflexota bacterium]